MIGPENPAWAAEYAAPMSRWIMFVVNVSIITLVSCIPIGLLLQRLDSSLEFERKNHERQNIEKEKLLIAFRKLQGEIIGRKKIEEALRESEDKFRLISEQSLMGIMISQDRRVKYANEALSKLSGYTTEEILSWEPNESLKLIHPDYRELALEQGVKKESNDQEGVVPSYEVKGIRKSGEERWIDVYSRTITYQGRSANLTTLIDVTGRRKDQEALRKSEKKYRDLIENIDEAIFTLDQAGRITYVSQACESIIGYKPEQLIGHSALDFIHEEDRPQMQLDFQKSINGKAEKSEYRIVHKSGEIRWAQSLSNVIYDGSQVVGLRGVLSNITEQKIAQAEKKKLEIKLIQAQKMEAIGTLAGGIAHDFNNILMAILGYAELARMDLSENKKALGNLDGIVDAGKRARDLVQQILTFSRQTEQEMQPVQVKIMIKEVLKLIRASLPTTVDIRHNITSDSLVMCDPTQIHQILMNLCTNAGFAMQEKGGVLEVVLDDVECDAGFPIENLQNKTSDCLRLTVSDTGCGIPAGILSQIFDPFFTTKEKGQGTGMGLAVVHGIIKDLGGTINVHSEPGKGSQFVILLPSHKNNMILSKNEDKANPGGTEHILLVDDEQPLVNVGKHLLEKLGYEVTTTTSSVEAFKLFLLQPNEFDLVISDLTMPRMTGYELSEKLLSVRPDIPIILCTGLSLGTSEEQSKKIGIRALVLKPLTSSEMAKSIRAVLDEEKSISEPDSIHNPSDLLETAN